MAVLFAFEEPRRFGETYAREFVCCCSFLLFVDSDRFFCLYSVRFAPPLVISDEDMKEAVKIIGECLVDFDQVS